MQAPSLSDTGNGVVERQHSIDPTRSHHSNRTLHQVVVRQHEPLCSPCLHDSISAKARSAIRSHALIRPGDTVVLAYSGGHASALLLHLLAAMRSLNLKHPEKRKVCRKGCSSGRTELGG